MAITFFIVLFTFCFSVCDVSRTLELFKKIYFERIDAVKEQEPFFLSSAYYPSNPNVDELLKLRETVKNLIPSQIELFSFFEFASKSHDMETLYHHRIELPIAHIYGSTGELLRGADINKLRLSSKYLAVRIPIISALIDELENEFNTFIVEMKLENMLLEMESLVTKSDKKTTEILKYFLEQIEQLEIHEKYSYLIKAPFERAKKKLKKLNNIFCKKDEIRQVLLVLRCESAIGLLKKELSAKIKMMPLQVDDKQYLNVYVYKRFGHKLQWYSRRIITKFHQMKSETNAIKRQLQMLYDSVEFAVFEIKNSILQLLDLLCDQAKMELFKLHDKLNEIDAEDDDGQPLTIHLILKINKIADGAVNVYKQLEDDFSCNNMPRKPIEFQRQACEQQELAREMHEFELAHKRLPTLNDVKRILMAKFLNPKYVEKIVAPEKDNVKRAYEMPSLD